VHQIRTALSRPLAGLRGPTSKGRGGKRREEKRKEIGRGEKEKERVWALRQREKNGRGGKLITPLHQFLPMPLSGAIAPTHIRGLDLGHCPQKIFEI